MESSFFMNAAIQEAFKAFDEGEVPIGAVLVIKNQIVGRGYNRIEKLQDATAHAEIIAMTAASSKLESWRLDECTLYVTIEPCLMCLGAILQSRISKICYGAPDSKAGAIDSFYHRQECERAYGYFPLIESGVLAQQCSELVTSFFKQLRKK